MHNNATIDRITDTTALARAVSDPTRVRILMALAGGEVCACHLADLVRLDPSTISRHLAVLKAAGLVVGRKAGRWVHYRRPAAEAAEPVARTLAWLDALLAESAQVAADREELASYPCEASTASA